MVAGEAVKKYIRSQRKAGFRDNQIRAAMRKAGYTPAQINEAFAAVPAAKTPAARAPAAKAGMPRSMKIGIIAIVAVAAIGGLAYFMFFGLSDEAQIQGLLNTQCSGLETGNAEAFLSTYDIDPGSTEYQQATQAFTLVAAMAMAGLECDQRILDIDFSADKTSATATVETTMKMTAMGVEVPSTQSAERAFVKKGLSWKETYRTGI
ncbi:MAG: hypothetical protein ACE5J7_05030 [Candidatus Aenigmatarchaeota archaeon]